MSASEMKAVVEATLEEQEKALFVSAVASETLDSEAVVKGAGKTKATGKKRTSKKAAPVAVEALTAVELATINTVAATPAVEPVEDLAAKNAAVVAAAFAAAKAGPAPVATQPDAPVLPVIDFSDLALLLLGPDVKDAEEMEQYFAEGQRLHDLASKVNLWEEEHKAKREAWGYKYTEIKAMEKRVFQAALRNELSTAVEARFKELQDAYHETRKDQLTDAVLLKKQDFEMLITYYISKDPEAQVRHEENLAKAEAVMQKLEELRASNAAQMDEARNFFELGNAIATKHGWPTRKAESKSNKKEVMTTGNNGIRITNRK